MRRKEIAVLVLTVAIALPLELIFLGLNWAPGSGPDWLDLIR